MKTNIFILIMAAFLVGGCGSGSSTSDESVNDTPVESTPEENIAEDSNGTYTPPIQKVVAGWYMRTVVKATSSDGTEYIHKSAGVFGELDESSNEADRHDIASFKSGILQIVFTPEWDENGGTYFSDYRSYTSEQKQVWTFQVKNPHTVDLSNADLNLKLEGAYDVYKGDIRYEEELSSDNSKKRALILIDIDNQREYGYDELETANLTMDGLHTRTFRWVLGTVDASDYDRGDAQTPVLTKSTVPNVSAKTSAAFDPYESFGPSPSF